MANLEDDLDCWFSGLSNDMLYFSVGPIGAEIALPTHTVSYYLFQVVFAVFIVFAK